MVVVLVVPCPLQRCSIQIRPPGISFGCAVTGLVFILHMASIAVAPRILSGCSAA